MGRGVSDGWMGGVGEFVLMGVRPGCEGTQEALQAG